MKYYYPYFTRFSLFLFCSIFLIFCATPVSPQAKTAQEAFELGLACNELDYDCQINYYTIAIQLKPDVGPGPYANRGQAYYFKNNFDLALSDFDKAIQLNPSLAKFYNFRALVYEKKGNYDAAIADCNKALQLDSNDPFYYSTRGRIYGAKKNYDLAIADLNKAIQLKPDYSNAYFSRGEVYRIKREYDLAIADYNKVIQLQPNNANGYSRRGVVYARKEKYDLAIADLNKAIQLKPDLPEAYLWRGDSYADKGDYDLAIQDFTKAIQLKPDDPIVFYHRAWAYLLKNLGDNACRDASLYLQNSELKDATGSYALIVGYLGFRKDRKNALATGFLRGWMTAVKNIDPWATAILKYFNGELTSAQLLALADDDRKKTEAHAYIGEMLLLANNKPAAFTHFKWVRDNGRKASFEYTLAIEELKR